MKGLPGIIESLEEQVEIIHTKMADPEVYRNKNQVVSLNEELAKVESELSLSYALWVYLEGIE